MSLEINKLYCCDCLDLILQIENNYIDLTVTSCPYDNLRQYKGYSFNFEEIAKELFRITKPGGVLVWVVGDAVIKGSESGTSFKQALYFKEIGFNLHDTMIYQKGSFPPNFPGQKRYQNCFEYMFVLSKGTPKTFNPILRDKKPCSVYSRKTKSSFRNKDGSFTYNNSIDTTKTKTIELNVWKVDCGYMKSTKDKIAYKHPAIFPDKLAERHILSWSNPGDLVFDPLVGAGTTCKMAKILGRNWLGCDISQEYIDISNERINSILI